MIHHNLRKLENFHKKYTLNLARDTHLKLKTTMSHKDDEAISLREEIDNLNGVVEIITKSITIASETIAAYKIENENLKAVAIVLKESIVVLEGDNDMITLKEEYRQEKERLIVVNNKVVELEEEILVIREELKRKRVDEDNVVDDNEEMETKGCIICEKLKSLSSFGTKINKKNKEDKLVSYTVIRDIFHACRQTKYREKKKKAKISK